MPFPHADVLILGSGLAGLSTAVNCRREGLHVLVCSKSHPGIGSCSAISQGYFRACTDTFTLTEHKRITLQAGKGLNDLDKVENLATNAAQDVLDLQNFGIPLEVRAKGYDCQAQKLGQEGLCITKPMTKYAKSLGVSFHSPFFAWRIAVQNDRAIGVWGFEPGSNQPRLLTSRCVIFATGGAGAIYAHTDNPQGMIGDGFALGLAAGLPLMDMEFVQFYPLCTGKGRTKRVLPSLLGEVGILENVHGEDIVSKYSIQPRPLARAARDELCQAMAMEAEAGLTFSDGKLRLRVQQKDSVWQKAQEMFGLHQIDAIKSWTDQLIAVHRGNIPVRPAAHFFMGGIATRADGGSSSLQGFFAVGEVAGGLHGANRLGGNALAETVVFGRISAAGATQVVKNLQDPNWSKLEIPAQYLNTPVTNQELNYSSLRFELQKLLWRDAGIIRSAKSLRRALQELDDLAERIERHTASSRHWIKALELANMLLVAQTIIRAALARVESRGSHYRSDYPDTDQAWNKHIFQRLEDKRLRLDWN